jgi:hypothetical protein
MALAWAQSPMRHEQPESPRLAATGPASGVAMVDVATPVCWAVVSAVAAMEVPVELPVDVVATVLPVPVPLPVLLVGAVAWPVPVPEPVPVDKPVALLVRVSVWVAVALCVRESLVTLVTGSVRTPVDVLVGLVAMAVTVWVADLVPVPLAVLLRVATLVVVDVSGEVTVEVPLPMTQIFCVWHAWLVSAQTPELGQALFMLLYSGRAASSMMTLP